MIKLRFLYVFLLLSLCLFSCDDNLNNPNTEIPPELEVLSTYPLNDSTLKEEDSLLSVKFDNKIFAGTMSIKVLDYINNMIIETIPLSNIQIKDSSIFFRISNNLENTKKYYILLDSGAITFSEKKYNYKGITNNTVWRFEFKTKEINDVELRVLSKYPVNDFKIIDYKTPFKISFDNKISPGNLIIQIADYYSLKVVHTINPIDIILEDSSLSFTLTGDYIIDNKYSIFIGDSAIKYSDKMLPVRGLNGRNSWVFFAGKRLPDDNIMKATISGQYNYQFEVTGSIISFSYSNGNKEILIGTRHPTSKHELILLFLPKGGNNNEYSLTSGLIPSSYTVSFYEDYESTPAGKIKVLINDDNIFEGEFNFTGKERNGSRTVNVNKGYIFVRKK